MTTPISDEAVAGETPQHRQQQQTQMPHLRIGGVPEHFNLPWRLAIEEGLFERAVGCTAEWIDYPGGTGKIMDALRSGEVDIATPLTEGAVTAIANGNQAKLVRLWTKSPLLWGIHVAGGDRCRAQTLEDLDEDSSRQRFAISRFGSGSELMSRVLAEDRGWNLADSNEQGEVGDDDDDCCSKESVPSKKWVVVQNLNGALKALPKGDADIFLWNKSMTQPHCDDGTFRRVGVLPTPWPAFVVATRDGVDFDLVSKVTTLALARAAMLHVSDDAMSTVMKRFGLADADARSWLDQVEYEAPAAALDLDMLASVTSRMATLGRIQSSLESANECIRDACVARTTRGATVAINDVYKSDHNMSKDDLEVYGCSKHASRFATDEVV